MTQNKAKEQIKGEYEDFEKKMAEIKKERDVFRAAKQKEAENLKIESIKKELQGKDE